MPQLAPFYFFNQVSVSIFSIDYRSNLLCIITLCLVLVLFSLMVMEMGIAPGQKLVHKENTPERFNVDLYYERLHGSIYVYDKLDATGGRMNSLFLHRGYGSGVLHGRSCVVVSPSGRIMSHTTDPTRFARLSAIPNIAAAVEANCSILSNTMPILRTNGTGPNGVVTYWIRPQN